MLELGCGAGRIAIGMYRLGYTQIVATDIAVAMVAEARRISSLLQYSIEFEVADATHLHFEDATFAGAIFGFNGLMQILGRPNRQQAMREIFRVLKPGAHFVFTTHDRDAHWRRGFWKKQRALWNTGQQHPALVDFGDLFYETPEGGMMYLHSPTCQEIRVDLKAASFEVVWDKLRSQMCRESEQVRDFSDDCRFWVAQRPNAN